MEDVEEAMKEGIKLLLDAAEREMEIAIKYLQNGDINRAIRHVNSGKNIISNVKARSR